MAEDSKATHRATRGIALLCSLACPLFVPTAQAETLRYRPVNNPTIQEDTQTRKAFAGNPYAARRAARNGEREFSTAPPPPIPEPPPQIADNRPPPAEQARPVQGPLRITIPNPRAVRQAALPQANTDMQTGASPLGAPTPLIAATAAEPVRKPFPLNPAIAQAAAMLAPAAGKPTRSIEDIISNADDPPAPARPAPPPTPAQVAASVDSARPNPKKIADDAYGRERAEAAQLAQLTPAAGGDAAGVATPLIATPPDAPTAATGTQEIVLTPVQPAPAAPTAQPAAEPAPLLAPPPAVAASPEPAAPAPQPAVAPDTTPLLDQAAKLLDDHKANYTPAPENVPAAPMSVQKKAPADAKPAVQMSEPEMSLSPASKKIAKKLPSNLDRKPKKGELENVDVDHVRDMSQVFPEEPKVETVTEETPGMKIEIKKRAVNLDYELEKAYNALLSGQTSAAIDIYKGVLANDPRNTNALFGLATTYHRAGQIDLARPLYAKLLAVDPKNRDALNNFLVLMADEAPEQALAQLGELEKRNPEFSPIPAQMAVIYQKLGDSEHASEKMFRAIALAPENLTYRYNLAIMLDRQKKYDEAAKLYRQVVEAGQRGEVIPGNLQKIQERLTFISSNRQ